MAKVYSDIKKKSTAGKIVSGILGIIFVALLVVGIIVGTYMFNTPSRDGESKELISGQWVDEKQNIMFTFGIEGDFKMQTIKDGKEDKTLAKGWFKIDEESKKIKILVSPKERDESVNLGLNLNFFTNIMYKELDCPVVDQFSKKGAEKNATCKFAILNTDNVYECKRVGTLESLYGSKTKNDDLKK